MHLEVLDFGLHHHLLSKFQNFLQVLPYIDDSVVIFRGGGGHKIIRKLSSEGEIDKG